jgi:hypothetical protein
VIGADFGSAVVSALKLPRFFVDPDALDAAAGPIGSPLMPLGHREQDGISLVISGDENLVGVLYAAVDPINKNAKFHLYALHGG